MSDVYLTSVDASQKMARYNRMTVQPTLFGEWCGNGVGSDAVDKYGWCPTLPRIRPPRPWL